MTKLEFLNEFSAELQKRRVADAEDILEEYEQHFTFKLADGFSEEEIAAKLGNPKDLAAQFDAGEAAPRKSSLLLARVGLAFADLAEGLVFCALLGFGLVLIAGALAFCAVGLCLIFRQNLFGVLPYLPFAPALILGLSLLALAVLTYTGCVWYGGYLRQSLLAYGRFRHNVLAKAEGRAALPPVPARPQMSGKKARCLRNTARLSLTVFALLFVAGFAVAAIQAGSFQFWHTWHWFGYEA